MNSSGADGGKVRIRRKRGARNDPQYVESCHHSEHFSTQLFAAITYNHHTSLIHIPTRPPSERKDKKDHGGMDSVNRIENVWAMLKKQQKKGS